MSNTHHPLSPSKSPIWANCAGAPNIWEHSPALFSNAANEGLTGHKILEACHKLGLPADHFLGAEFVVDGDTIICDEEMVAAIDKCLLIVKNFRATHVISELKVFIDQVFPGLYGFSDFAIYNSKLRKLIILDFKYGRTPVSASSSQLILYAIGAALLDLFIDVEEIELIVVQPRDFNQQVKRHNMHVSELEAHAVDLNKKALATQNPNAPRTPGLHCKYCPGKIQCPEYLHAVKNLPQPPFDISEEKLTDLLNILGTLDQFKKQVKEVALNFKMAGKNIPQYKIVRRQTKRKVIDDKKLIAALDADPTLDNRKLYLKESLVGIGDLEKLNRKYLPEHLFKPRGGLDLAPMSDSRPAVATAAEHFNKTGV